MSAVIGVSLEQVGEFKAALARLTEESRGRIVVDAALAGAQEILEAAKENAPVLQEPDDRRIVGNLRDKIKAYISKQKPGVVTVSVGLSKEDMRAKEDGAFYAGFVEFGTARMAARPYLRPAMDARQQSAADKCIGVFAGWLESPGA